MSRDRSIIRVWTVLAVVALATACGGGDSDSPTAPPPLVPDPPRATTVTVSPAMAELVSGATEQLCSNPRFLVQGD